MESMVYKASSQSKTKPEMKTTMAFMKEMSKPRGISRFWLNTMLITSKPPVEAPDRKMKPMAAPTITPPKTEERMGSSEIPLSGITCMLMEVTATEIRV